MPGYLQAFLLNKFDEKIVEKNEWNAFFSHFYRHFLTEKT